jgi:hypothetical protein
VIWHIGDQLVVTLQVEQGVLSLESLLVLKKHLLELGEFVLVEQLLEVEVFN